PDDGYEPMRHDPRAGVIGLGYDRAGYLDYATAIGDALDVNYGRRHRLEKKDPSAEVSEAVEPIVYYVDRGAPEPVRSALIDGAGWWNDAFEAAGYTDAFQVRLLPEGIDPMDVRYNVIQWVHRSTRGWSYGSSVLDPRTGEIIKGHVTLGSLRVRQDYMIAEGLLAPYVDESMPDDMIDMSLARIRQLSAHEVGHTLGFEHNFAASTQDRASVMDYPFPLIRFTEDGRLDLSDAYGVGIGDWDKRTVIYAYQDFPDRVDGNAQRREIMAATIAEGFAFVADGHSRSVGSAHPDGNLWDNGADAIEELSHLVRIRRYALDRFSERVIREGRPLAKMEEVLVPIYLIHRFQLHAVGKLIGGQYFAYNLRGDGQDLPAPVSSARQQQAIDALLTMLEPDVLRLPDEIINTIPPRPPGHPGSQETFAGETGVTFDLLAPAAASVTLTLEVLLNPARAARMARGSSPTFESLVDSLLRATWYRQPFPALDYDALQRQTNMLVLEDLMRLALDETADTDVRSVALAAVDRIHRTTGRNVRMSRGMLRFLRLVRFKIERALDDPASVAEWPTVTPPPGSPIGAAGALLDILE
ncbi:MAG: zinc-dependent metalloprotease, partial [Woeseiaceae bacterium]